MGCIFMDDGSVYDESRIVFHILLQLMNTNSLIEYHFFLFSRAERTSLLCSRLRKEENVKSHHWTY